MRFNIPLKTLADTLGVGETDVENFLDSLIGTTVPESLIKTKTTTEGTLSQIFGLNNKDKIEPMNESVLTHDNGDILRENDLKVIHIHDNLVRNIGLTIAYRIPDGYTGKNAPTTIEVATAIVHPHDTFSKKTGTRVAANNFIEGRTVLLPLCAGLTIPAALRMYFAASIYR